MKKNMHEIKHNGKLLAVRDSIHSYCPLGLSFYGGKEDAIQVGKFRYDKGKKLRDHRHIVRPRVVEKTQEILIVFKGSVKVTTYSQTGKEIVDECLLLEGDYYISYYGGVGFDVLEDDTRMLEIKPGTYLVDNDDLERELL